MPSKSKTDETSSSSNIVPFKRPINWKNMRADEAERLIKERTKAGNFIIGTHAFERQEERSPLTSLQVIDILSKGFVIQTPAQNQHGDWEAVIEKRMPGGRTAGAATIVFHSADSVFVKTVMWIDPK